MIWGPFLLALALGLVVSAGLYFAYLWPQVEPEDEDEEENEGEDEGENEASEKPAGDEPAAGASTGA